MDTGKVLSHWLLVLIGIAFLAPQSAEIQTEYPLDFVFRESEFTDSDWAGLATTLAHEMLVPEKKSEKRF